MAFGMWTAMPNELPEETRTAMLHEFTRVKADLQAAYLSPPQKVTRVEITTIEGPTDLIDDSGAINEYHAMWVVEADVYLEQAGNLGG